MDSRTEEQKIDDFETDEFQEELRKTKRLSDDFLERINRPEDYNFIYRNNEQKPFFPKGIINNEIEFPFEINGEGNLIYKVNETDTIRPENDFTPFTTITKKVLVSQFILRKNANISGQPFYEFHKKFLYNTIKEEYGKSFGNFKDEIMFPLIKDAKLQARVQARSKSSTSSSSTTSGEDKDKKTMTKMTKTKTQKKENQFLSGEDVS